MDEAQSDKINLKSNTYDLFNKFFYHVEKNNRLECFRSDIERLIELLNNN